MGTRMYSADGNSGTGHGGRGGRRAGRIRLALVGLLAAGVAVACGPAEGDGPAVRPPLPASASATPAASPTPSPSATPSALPSPTRTTPDAKAPTGPAPARTADDPAPEPTAKAKTPEQPAKAGCEITSNAGNCYNAGQYCRKADVGRSTHAGNGRMITCRQDGGQPRWGY
ncbi:hypothetical protein WDV06_11150 [Streptomyces racemochromogenes]|uniref:Lipoprotein n=1 Tax=Streptomyces racemochromogenes TaxID=67353 RepID=A0ABW7PBA0_9ACTN